MWPRAGVACSPNLVDHEGIPNYSVWGPKGELYVTDFAQAVIWRVPPGGGTPQPWFTDKRLDGLEFGTAGIALSPDRKALYVMQQTSLGLGELSIGTGKLYKLPIASDGRPGSLSKVWESRLAELPDGFGIAKSGRIYIGNAGLLQQIVVLDAAGKEIERFPETPLTRRQRIADPVRRAVQRDVRRQPHPGRQPGQPRQHRAPRDPRRQRRRARREDLHPGRRGFLTTYA